MEEGGEEVECRVGGNVECVGVRGRCLSRAACSYVRFLGLFSNCVVEEEKRQNT